MKSYLFLLPVAAIFGALSAFACGSGEIQLNDDTVLRPEGFFFPISDPHGKNPYLIERWKAKYVDCVRKNPSGIMDGKCTKRVRLTDSKGNPTHRAQLELKGDTATYVVTDLLTHVSKTYRAQLHARGGCGLEEVTENLADGLSHATVYPSNGVPPMDALGQFVAPETGGYLVVYSTTIVDFSFGHLRADCDYEIEYRNAEPVGIELVSISDPVSCGQDRPTER